MTKFTITTALLSLICLFAMQFSAFSKGVTAAPNQSMTTDMVLFEDFEGDVFPPAGWSSHNLAGDDATWALSTTVNHTPGGSNSAWHDWTATDGWLVSPPVTLPDEVGFTLSFWSYNSDLWAYGSNEVWISTGSGDPADEDFVEVWTAVSPLEFTWEEIVIELDDYAGETIYMAFLKTGDWAHVWNVDDVQVGVFEPVVTYNLTFEVQDEDGINIDNAIVTVEGVANAPGDYLFEDLLPGEYNYQITAADYEPSSGSVNIVDEDVSVTVVLTEIPLYTLTFIVEDEDGVLIDNAQIILQNETNTPGDYVFTDLVAGVYEYTVFSEGYDIVNGTVDVSEDTTETVTLIELEVLVVSEFPFNELFGDDSETRDFWSQILVEGNALWSFAAGAGGGQPQNPYIGNLNARYVSQTGTNSPITKLVTPFFDMSGLTNPRLVFYYAQHQTGVPWNPNQNQTKVYYRTAPGSEWVELIHLTENIFEWTEVVLALPEHTATYQLAFEGINNGGRANVIDNVIIEETPPSFDVTFVVEDPDGDPITNAVITLADQTNPAGNYFFPDMEVGELPYSISATNYTTVDGVINIVDEDVTEYVTMNIHQEAIPYFEDFTGVPNGEFPEHWSRNTTNWYVTNSKLSLWDYMYEPVVRRAYTPLIDATEMSDVMLSFNQEVWDFGGGYTLKVETSLDGDNWTTQWAWDIDAEEGLPPNDIAFDLEEVEGHLFYLAFTLDGLSGDNDWQIDFLNVTGTEALVEYTVTFHVEDADTEAMLEGVEITVDELDPIYTDSDGLAALDLLDDSYTAVVVFEGYQSQNVDFTVAGEAKTVHISLVAEDDDPIDPIDDFPWSEDFVADWEGTPAAPAGWTAVNGASGSYWQRSGVQSVVGGFSARSYQGAASSNLADEWLITPALNLDNAEATMLAFFGLVTQAPDGVKENMRIMILDDVYDNAADLHANATEIMVIPFTQTWTEYIVDLSDYSGVKYLAFNYLVTDDDDTAFAWIYVDDVRVGDFDTFTLTMLESEGEGTVVPAEGTHHYLEGTVVSLNATPDYTWEFEKWEVDGDFFSAEPSATVTITADIEVKAFFTALDSFTLTMEDPDGEGTVSPEVGDHTYLEDDEVTLTATPDIGWDFSHWTGAVEDPDAAVTSIIMDDDYTVKAHFVPFEAFELPWFEGFDGLANGMLPSNWTRTHTNWGVWNTNNAEGDSAPELRFNWQPSATDLFRVATPAIDGTDETSVSLTFMHMLNDYSGGYDLKIQTSIDGGDTWVDQWVLNIGDDKESAGDREKGSRNNIPATEVTVELTGVGGHEFHIAFVYEGNSFNVNQWYIDDIAVGEFEAPDMYTVTFDVADADTEAALEGAMIVIGTHDPLYTDSDGIATIDLADGTYSADVTLEGYVLETVDFTVDGEAKTVHVSLTAEEEPEGDLLFVQQWYDGGTAATSVYDTAAEVDYEAADNFMDVDGVVDQIVIYGLTLKFNGSWAEQVPDPIEPFIIRFYDYEEEFVPGLEAPEDGTYEVALQDSFGDGWNGGLLSVFVNGVVVLDEITMDSGAGPDYHTFTAEAGDEISTVYVEGSWSYENYYAILDPSENIIAEEGGTWDDPGDSTPGSINPGGMFAMEPDWDNPVSEQTLDADVTTVGPVWNNAYTLYRFAMDLDEEIDLEQGWMSAQIDADNGSGTWFLWMNSLEGDGLAYQRVGEFPDLADRALSTPLSIRQDGQVQLTRSALDYDFGFELWGGEATDPVDAIDDFPWFEDFEALWVDNPGYEESPEGWFVVNGASGSYWQSTTVQSNTGERSARSYQGAASSNLADEWLISPAFNLDNPDATQMIFHGYSNQAPDGTRENMRIMLLDQPYDNVADLHANATEIIVIPFTQTWEEYLVNLESYSGVKHIAFNYYITDDMNATFNWIYIDDIVVGSFDIFTLTMLDPVGGGTVSPEVGDHDFTENTVVPLLATADMGYTFSHWTGDVEDPNSAATTVLMDDDKTVQAHFVDFDGIDLPWTEDFTGIPNNELPSNWVRTHPNWGVWNTSNAGGEAPEMRFNFSPSSVDLFRLTSPKINTSGYDALLLSFDHYVNNFSAPGIYTLRVIAIADDVEYVVQEWVDPDNIGPEFLELILTEGQHGVGTDDFYIAWELDGDSYDINQWYFDNVFLGEAPDMYEVTFFVGEDNVDETPIEGASINIDGDVYHTDENGLAVFMLVDDQTYTANVTASGYVAQEVTFTVDGADVSVDVLLMDNIVEPFNLSVITEDMDPGEALFIWNDYGDEYEFRYDDGVVDAQLGFQGTWNSVMGAVHFNDAILHEITWYLTEEGGPHSTVKVWVLGLTPGGLPDRNNVVYTAENVPNNDNEWNFYEFDTPIEMPEGFFIGLSYPGFLGLAVDDGVGEPWDFVPGTQFGVFDITDATSEFTDISVWGFEVNYLLRAYGNNLGDLNRSAYSGSVAQGPAPELIPLETRVDAGKPHYPQAGQRTFLGFNVYLNDALVAEEIMDTEYLFTDLPAGEHTAGVQSVYTTGSSDIVTIDFEITDEAETFEVTFEVDITQAVLEGQLMGFDPDLDHIFMTGSMVGWAEPGSAETVMTHVSSEPWIYAMTLDLAAGTYEYKYFSDFLGDGWDGGEWPGDPNRVVEVTGDMVVADEFEVGDAPEYTVTFDVFDTEGDAIDNAVITFGGVENPAGDYVFEGVTPGTYAFEVTADGYKPFTGELTVGDADLTIPVELEPEVSVGEVDELDLSIFPNPAREMLYIESGSDITGVRVVDILGQVVYSSSVDSMSHELSVTGFDPGVYFIQVTTTRGVVTHRVQVSR